MIRRKHSWGLQVGLLSVCCLTVIGLIAGNSFAGNYKDDYRNKHHKKAPVCEKAKNMKIIGYNDVQGRETLQVSVKGKFAFIGHHNRNKDYQPIHYNPLTGKDEENGTTILDISNPTKPTVVVHIPNFNFAGDEQENRNSRSASVVYNFMDSNKDFLVRNSEGNGTWYFEVFDITNITREGGVTWVKLGNLQSTGVDQCGTDCGGILTNAHKGYFSQSGFYYGTPNEPGFTNGGHLVVWDLRDLPSVTPGAWNQELGASRFVGRAWIEGQKKTDTTPVNLTMHHPTVEEENSRVFAAYLSGGNVASFNIDFYNAGDAYGLGPHPDAATGAYKRFPTAWEIDTQPPYRGTHTVAPVYYDKVPNFSGDAQNRVYALVADEAGGGDIVPCSNGVRTKAYMMDITDADQFLGGTGTPFNVETWEVPVGDFCEKGGRFGPHQFNETQNGMINGFEDKIAYFAYFNAGVRAVDISDPANLKEVGYCIPPPNENTTGVTLAQNTDGYKVIQINDVDTDAKGLVYATDRVGSGFFVMKLENWKQKYHHDYDD